MSKNLTQENHFFLIRDGHRYRVTEIEKLVGWTARFSFVDVSDGKAYSMIQMMSKQFWDDVENFQKMKRENSIPGQQFVIEMKKNPDGSAEVHWETMGLRDPNDRRYA